MCEHLNDEIDGSCTVELQGWKDVERSGDGPFSLLPSQGARKTETLRPDSTTLPEQVGIQRTYTQTGCRMFARD